MAKDNLNESNIHVCLYFAASLFLFKNLYTGQDFSGRSLPHAVAVSPTFDIKLHIRIW